jgi:hypothetical protein
VIFDGGNDEAKLAIVGWLLCQQPRARLIGAKLESIDVIVIGQHELSELGVAVDQSMHGPVDCVLDFSTHEQHLIAEHSHLRFTR